MLNSFRFAHPLWFLLFLPVFWAWMRTWWQRPRAVTYSSVALVGALPRTFVQHLRPLVASLRWLALGLFIFALARPQQGQEEFRARAEGIAIMMCLDRSGSMRADDFDFRGRPVTRLEAVKQVFRDFVVGKEELPGRPDDFIGLVVFGGFAESLCPLTLDHDTLVATLEPVRLPEPIRDRRGAVLNRELLQEEMQTAIGDALALGIDRIKNATAKSKVIILLSDGENNAGAVTPEAAAATARQLGIKIYSIGIGATENQTRRDLTPFRFFQGQPQPSAVDEKTLRHLAEVTEGQYFHASNTRALAEVYGAIDKLEKTTQEGKLYTQYRELYHFCLFPGLVFLLLELVLTSTRFRGLP